MVVQIAHEGRPRGGDLPVVDEIALLRIDGSGYFHVHNEGVPVHSSALVPLWKGRQPVGSLKPECLDQRNLHDAVQDTSEATY